MAMKNPGDFFGELLKLLRSQWLTREQIRGELRCSDTTLRSWLDALHAQGLVSERPSEPSPRRLGPRPKVYALTKPWGGIA
ncbi:MAG: hypothetical protein QM750_19975 [Rubrivivax sp.]